MPTEPFPPVGRELAAALHVLAAPFVRRRAAPHFDLQRGTIDFGALLAQPWSSSERALIETACTLAGREDIADARLAPLLYVLDDENFERVIEAIRIRRGHPPRR